jgi:hypothetical protein
MPLCFPASFPVSIDYLIAYRAFLIHKRSEGHVDVDTRKELAMFWKEKAHM